MNKEEYLKNVERLREADNAYYNSGNEIMSNFEYDTIRNDVAAYETNHPEIEAYALNHVGAAVVSELKKVTHEFPALSLDKTKDMDLFIRKFNEGTSNAWHSENVVLMWKMDGSTCVAEYEDGKLHSLATRGNGYVGSDITHNAPFIKGLPQTIPYKGKIIIRGEAVMSYQEFNRINAELPLEEQYKNPRNLCNATIQMLDSNEMRKRKINFKCFDWVYSDQLPNDFIARFEILKEWGIDCVEYHDLTTEELKNAMKSMENRVETYEFPVDGLVACLSDVMYADTLPGTEHNPNIMRGYAFKWADEEVETTLRDIEWSASRTGLLNPVAVFDTVDLCGTEVSRASLHNLSYIADKDLRIGDTIKVYKANMIIPQCSESVTAKMRPVSNVKNINSYINITECPVCEGSLGVNESNDTFTVICTNPDCAAKKIGKFAHFCERDCMNIVGLSEETLTKFIERGFIRNFRDIYMLDSYKAQIISMDGFGEKAYENIMNAIEKSKKTDFVSFIHACGIPNIGKGQAKLLRNFLDTKMAEYWEDYADADGSYDLIGCLAWLCWQVDGFDFTCVDGFGDVISKSLNKWVNEELVDAFCRYEDTEVSDVLKFLTFTDEPLENSASSISGKTFVITGSLNHYKNRDELVSVIESLGGKVSGSVSKNTDFLINNDTTSESGKNKKAKELGIPVISEDEFADLLGRIH